MDAPLGVPASASSPPLAGAVGALPIPMEVETTAVLNGATAEAQAQGHGQAEPSAPPTEVQQAGVPRELQPLKVAFYELLIRQLQDDGLVGEAQSLSQQLHIQPNAVVGKDALFEAYGKSLKWAFGDRATGDWEHWQHLQCVPVPPLGPQERFLNLDGAAAGLTSSAGAPASSPSPGSSPRASAPPAPGGTAAALPSLAAGAGGGVAASAAVASAAAAALSTSGEPGVQGLGARRAPEIRLLYTAQHQQGCPCRAVAFSPDGRSCAAGFLDGSIKLLDCARMRACAVSTDGPLARMRITEEELLKPITRTLHDHVLGVTCLAFHPLNPTLFSGSMDKAVKIFDLTRPPGHKKAFSVLQDVHTVRCLSIHPCGDFLFVGTAHQAVRLYDLQTLNCFTTFNQQDHHGGSINDLRCTSDGRIFASASSDGAIHLWDAVSHRVANRLPKAHSGAAVTSLRWSRNLNYMLTSGADGRHRLWDVRQGREVFCMGFGPRSCEFSKAVFVSGERCIASSNSNTRLSDVSLFDAQTGSPVFMKLGMHTMPVHALEASPIDKTLVTGCDDHKARYFAVEERRIH